MPTSYPTKVAIAGQRDIDTPLIRRRSRHGGFIKRKMEDRRRQVAEQEAAPQKANPRRCRAAGDRLERAPGQANAHAVLADHRGRHHGRLLVLAGALPSLPHRRVI
jgi:hypothetical protein